MEAVQSEEYKGYQINIYYDDTTQSPREWDNVATFVCCHRRYNLGDRQDMDACIDELFDKHVNAKDVVAYFIKSRNARWVQNGTEDYDGSYDKYLEWNDGKEYFGVDDNTPDEDLAYNYINDELTNGEKLMLVEQSGNVAMLPISMYDHSGITLWLGSTRGHVDVQWDCSSVGFAYVEKDRAEKEMPQRAQLPGIDNTDWKQWAYEMMEGEMHTYDQYVRGNIYGWMVENGEDDFEDSCWGYIGDDGISRMIEEAKDAIDYHLKRKEEERKENCKVLAECINDFIGHTWLWKNESYHIGRDLFGDGCLEKAAVHLGHIEPYSYVNISDVEADVLGCIVNYINKKIA